jgi:type II secretory pathway pseudopilin PulG
VRTPGQDVQIPVGRRGEAGYNLVVLIVAVTILNVLLAASLPMWSTAIQREKEEELIFRGIQYAEALRVYQNRNQHFPARLEQLIETNQRCIRQLWKDPMTEDGKWGLIFQGQQNQVPVKLPGEQQGGGGPQRKPEGEDPEGDGEDDGDGQSAFGPRKGDEVAVGPIVGVYSKSGKKAIKTFFGKERYDEWRFTVDILTQQQLPPPGGDPSKQVGGFTGGGLVLSTRWLGRPLPLLDQFSQFPGGNLPQGSGPGTGTGAATGQRPPRPRPGPGSPNGP